MATSKTRSMLDAGPGNTVFVRDNLGKYWIVDVDSKIRHAVRSPETNTSGFGGSWEAALMIWGNPLTSGEDLPDSLRDAQSSKFGTDQIFLDRGVGYTEGEDVVSLFGGPNRMERFIAGQVRDPFVREFTDNPMDNQAGDGSWFRAEVDDTAPVPDAAPAPGSGDGGPPSDDGSGSLPDREFEDARDYLRNLLEPYGLNTDSLVNMMDDLVVDGANESEIWFALRDTDEYESRFGGNVMRREAGLRELAPGEYVQWEEQMRTMMQRAGLPEGFYDSPDDFDTFIGQGQGPALLADRINRGVKQLVAASPAVRDELDRLTAGRGDQGLLAFFMDPDRGMESIENLFMQAQSETAFDRQGFRLYDFVGEEAATRAQEAGLTIEQQRQQAQQAAEFVGQRRALFRESVSEGDDLREGIEGAQAGFKTDDGSAGRKIERRRKSRLSTQEGGGGASGGAGGVAFGAAD